LDQLTRIFCAVDYSGPAQAAFDQALALSRERSAELTVVHAIPKDQPFGRDARKRIATIAALRQAAEAAGVRFKVSVQYGNPAGVILLHAHARRPDLVVIGTHQRTGLERLSTGSIAETVILRAACPVLVVPAPAGGTVVKPPSSFENVLCSVDFSPASSTALRKALSLAKAGEGRVTLVHVVKNTSRTSARFMSHFRVPEHQTQLAHDAWRRLQDAIPPAERRPGRVHVRVVTGDPLEEIVGIAADVEADVIVVGVASRNVIWRRIFGATATRLMRAAGCPVLAVPELSRWGAGSPTEQDAFDLAA